MSMEELSQGLEGMDRAELALGAGMAGIVVTLMLVAWIAWFFVSALGYRKMFIKAGQAGWKAFIPYYRSYIRFGFAWNTNMFWPFLVTILVCQFMPTNAIALKIVTLVCAIIGVVLSIKLDIRVAKSFGKGAGWGVLLCFFPFIVSLILGYGKAEYIGNTTRA